MTTRNEIEQSTGSSHYLSQLYPSALVGLIYCTSREALQVEHSMNIASRDNILNPWHPSPAIVPVLVSKQDSICRAEVIQDSFTLIKSQSHR